jgi:hypothetical protein
MTGHIVVVNFHYRKQELLAGGAGPLHGNAGNGDALFNHRTGPTRGNDFLAVPGYSSVPQEAGD